MIEMLSELSPKQEAKIDQKPSANEIIGRIIYDLDAFVKLDPRCRRQDVAIVMTHWTALRIAPGIEFTENMRHFLFGHPVRFMDGPGIEWYITARHGFIIEEGTDNAEGDGTRP